MEKPQVITLGPSNVLQFLIKYVEMSQAKGAFILAESDILKRSVDVCYRGIPDAEIQDSQAIELLIQAIYKGQAHGDYTLNDSSLLFNVVNYINTNKLELLTRPIDPSIPVPATPEHDGVPAKEEVILPDDNDDDSEGEFDMSQLSAPVPLMPIEL